METLPEATRLLYTQLLSQCLQNAAPTGHGLSLVSKTIKGGKHWYLQVTVGSRKTQHYIGPDTNTVRDLIQREKALWQSAASDVADRQMLVDMLTRGGAHATDSVEARVFELLERAGLFIAGGVVVGSHAFAIYGNMLGARWDSQITRTQDIDVATQTRVAIGVSDRKFNLRQAIADSDLGFIEVPALNRKEPTTQYRIRGRQLSVDILTPMFGRTSSKPIYLRALDVFAQPVRFLDYLLADTQPAVLAARSGILVNVPSPARYALHKLVTAERRVVAFQSKRQKDLSQASQLLSMLARDRPGDLRRAWQAARKQPGKFMQQLLSGLAQQPQEVKSVVRKMAKLPNASR